METLRISGFANRNWMLRAIEELTALGLCARPAAGPAQCSLAILVSGTAQQLEPLRPLAAATALEAEVAAVPRFDWSAYINDMERLPGLS